MSLDKRHKTENSTTAHAGRMDKRSSGRLFRAPQDRAAVSPAHARGGAKAIELRTIDKLFGDTIILIGAAAIV
ncbi:MAG: hypothetical protein U0Z44_01140 [Kouleothrix sp.]